MARRIPGSVLLGGLALALAGCTSAPPPAAPAAAAKPAAAPAVHEKHWGYASSAETAGPVEWASLKGNEACRGSKQSPVGVGTKAPFPFESKDLPNLVFKYGKTGVHLVNNGHTLQADVDKGSAVERDGATWPLLQFHFHAPSEHTLDGLHYPMEMHLVHAGADGKPGLVVAVFLVQGGDNPALTPVFASLPKEKGQRRDEPSTVIDLDQLLPPDRGYVTYEGSLTTPPCTEGIRWFVLKSPGGVSGDQLGAFVTLFGMNPTNRPIQPLNGRAVVLDSTP
jgi:carbonic anhydrase